MKFLLFILPLAAYRYLFAQDGSPVVVWSTANKLWCTGTRPDASYSDFITKRCCGQVHHQASFTSDGFCTGKDTKGDGWFHDFDQCCGGHNALTNAYCINSQCPSKTVSIGGISHAVNGTSNISPDSPKPSDKTATSPVAKDSSVNTSSATDSDSNPTATATSASTTSSSTTSSSSIIAPSSFLAILISSIIISS